MSTIDHLISDYGLFLVAGVICIESIGLPVPGETILIAASIYSGSKHDLAITSVIFAAATGGIVGNMIGYVIGREFGYWVLLHYAPYLRISEGRIKLGQYLFLRHGGKIVVVARFVPVLRSLAGILAGANRMPWQPFLLANVAGACAWATIYGLAAYLFGKEAEQLAGPTALVVGFLVVIALVVTGMFVVRHEAQLAAEAERALPGPLQLP
jgi:membrane protein DedA with SNARE-associated domain